MLKKPTVIPDQSPKIDTQVYEPEVHALIGDQAILKCAVSGNPNPQISWSKDSTIVSITHNSRFIIFV